MRDSILLLVVFWGLALWLVLGLTGWLYRNAPRQREPEYMECPYCKEIALPVEGGECEHCHLESYF